MSVTNHLVPDSGHVAVIGMQSREKRLAVLNPAVLKRGCKIDLWLTLWAPLENVRLDVWQDV